MDCPKPSLPSEQRLQKVLAACGFGSRRACEALISFGRVAVDGRPVTEMGIRVDPTRHRIFVDGREINLQRLDYLLLNKPAGYLCTSRDPRGRPTFLDLVPQADVRWVTAGRLDADSEGLLLVTNDGDLIQSLIHPSCGVDKTYRVELDRPLAPEDLARFTPGMLIRGQTHRAVAIRPVRGSRPVYEIVLHQGLNRQIRRMAEAVGRRVTRLTRIRLGPLSLGSLKPGEWRKLTPGEVRDLKERRPLETSQHAME